MERTWAPPAGIIIRPITPADRDALSTFYAGLSEDSRLSRFHGVAPGISSRTAMTFCGPDHDHREGFVAVTADPPSGPPIVVGHLCLEPTGAGVFEMAVAVADRHQGCGIGRSLLETAIAWSGQHAVPCLRAALLTTNSAVLGLLRSTGRPVRFSTPAAGVVTATLELIPAIPTAA